MFGIFLVSHRGHNVGVKSLIDLPLTTQVSGDIVLDAPVKYARPTRLSESDGGQATLSFGIERGKIYD